MSSNAIPTFETLRITFPIPHVAVVELNRPTKLNTLNQKMWLEVPECFSYLHSDSRCRVIVLTGAGRMFSAGIDLKDMKLAPSSGSDPARNAFWILDLVRPLQASFTAVESCRKPVISAIHGACIGGGIDLISATDVRYCTADCYFQIKEVDIGMAADVGTLNRLPHIIGNHSLMRELAYTGRKMDAREALSFGLVSKVLGTQQEMMAAALSLAADIASKSPVGVQGTKVNLNYAKDHTVEDSLNHILVWNSAMLQTQDTKVAGMASITKKDPRTLEFPDMLPPPYPSKL
eukprot:gene2847-562_t